MFSTLAKLYKDWKFRRVLKKHGCETEEQYRRNYDPAVNHRANNLDTWYHGYPYVCKIEYYPDNFRERFLQMKEWCYNNCERDDWRWDWFRMENEFNLNSNEFNDLFGEDFLFFAFKQQKDFIWFTLRWTDIQ